MLRLLVVLSILLVSCAGTSSTCQTPVQDACSAKAQEVSAELAKIATQRGTTSVEMTTEFMNACEGQLQSDLDQTLANLQTIAADGGTTASKP